MKKPFYCLISFSILMIFIISCISCKKKNDLEMEIKRGGFHKSFYEIPIAVIDLMPYEKKTIELNTNKNKVLVSLYVTGDGENLEMLYRETGFVVPVKMTNENDIKENVGTTLSAGREDFTSNNGKLRLCIQSFHDKNIHVLLHTTKEGGVKISE